MQLSGLLIVAVLFGSGFLAGYGVMQLSGILIVAVLFGSGFLAGYGLRAMISWRRRRRFSRSREREQYDPAQMPLQFARPQSRSSPARANEEPEPLRGFGDYPVDLAARRRK